MKGAAVQVAISQASSGDAFFRWSLAVDIGGDRNRHKVPGYSNMMPIDMPPSAPAQPPAGSSPKQEEKK
jgi:hypothetical protein